MRRFHDSALAQIVEQLLEAAGGRLQRPLDLEQGAGDVVALGAGRGLGEMAHPGGELYQGGAHGRQLGADAHERWITTIRPTGTLRHSCSGDSTSAARASTCATA